MARNRWLLAFGLLASVVFIGLLSCSDDDDNCPSCPTPPDTTATDTTAPEWLVYYSYNFDRFDTAAIIPGYSTRELRAVDTLIKYPLPTIQNFQFTPDGNYVIYADMMNPADSMRSAVWVSNYQTGDTVSKVYVRGFSLVVSPVGDYLAAVLPTHHIYLYRLPGLEQVWADSGINVGEAIFLDDPDRLVYNIGDSLHIVPITNLDSAYTTALLTYDTVLHIRQIVFDAPTDMIYLQGYAGSLMTTVFEARRASDFSVVHRFPLARVYGLTLSPSGAYVFLSSNCGDDEGTVPGILVYDTRLRTVTPFADATTILEPAFGPRLVAVTPDDKYLCVANVYPCGWSGAEQGPLILFDIPTGEIRHIFYHNSLPGQAEALRVYPIPR